MDGGEVDATHLRKILNTKSWKDEQHGDYMLYGANRKGNWW